MRLRVFLYHRPDRCFIIFFGTDIAKYRCIFRLQIISPPDVYTDRFLRIHFPCQLCISWIPALRELDLFPELIQNITVIFFTRKISGEIHIFKIKNLRMIHLRFMEPLHSKGKQLSSYFSRDPITTDQCCFFFFCADFKNKTVKIPQLQNPFCHNRYIFHSPGMSCFLHLYLIKPGNVKSYFLSKSHQFSIQCILLELVSKPACYLNNDHIPIPFPLSW